MQMILPPNSTVILVNQPKQLNNITVLQDLDQRKSIQKSIQILLDPLRHRVFQARSTSLPLQMVPHEKRSHIPVMKNENGLGMLRLTMPEHRQFRVKNGLSILFARILAQNFEALRQTNGCKKKAFNLSHRPFTLVEVHDWQSRRGIND